jgi:hypothetical protein
MRYEGVVKRPILVALLMAAWVFMLIDLVWLAPSRLPSSLDLFVRAVVFDRRTFDPALIGLFYATGALVTLHASLVWAEEYDSQPHPIALVLIGYAFGSLFFLPYYAWRRAGQRRSGVRPWPAAPVTRWIIGLELLAAGGYAIVAGRFANLWTEVSGRWFSHFLLLDFVVLSLLLVALRAGKLAPRNVAEASTPARE